MWWPASREGPRGVEAAGRRSGFERRRVAAGGSSSAAGSDFGAGAATGSDFVGGSGSTATLDGGSGPLGGRSLNSGACNAPKSGATTAASDGRAIPQTANAPSAAMAVSPSPLPLVASPPRWTARRARSRRGVRQPARPGAGPLRAPPTSRAWWGSGRRDLSPAPARPRRAERRAATGCGRTATAVALLEAQTLRRLTKRAHRLTSSAALHPGVLIVVRRFRNDLGLFAHLHALVTDGCFEAADPDAPGFLPIQGLADEHARAAAPQAARPLRP